MNHRSTARVRPDWPALLLAFLSSAAPATAATFHVGGSKGNDGNDGSGEHPWKTIARASAALGPGDVCLLHAGLYRETLRPARSGTAGHPITYRAAGDGPVTVSAADPVTGWHRSAGDVFRGPMILDLGAGRNQVFVDGWAMVEARWPHVPWDPRSGFDLLAAPFARATATAGRATLAVPTATQPADHWRGATVWAEIGDRWTSQTATVVASAPGTLTLAGRSKPWFPDDNALFGSDGFVYLTGAPDGATAPGEWVRRDGDLCLITVDRSDPARHRVEVRTGRPVADLTGRDWITVAGINGFAGTAVLTGRDCVVQDCTFRYVTHDPSEGYTSHGGIEVSGRGNLLLRCVVDTSSGNGIRLDGSDNVVRGCVVANVDYDGDYSAAVQIGGTRNGVERSTLTRAGRALVAPYGTAAVVRYNDLSHAMLLTQDGGALYTWNVDGQGTLIDHNWVHDSVPLPEAKGPYDGIYLDDGCRNFVVHHNVVWATRDGMRLGHIYPASGDRVFNNTFWGNEHAMVQHGEKPLTDIRTWNNLSDRDEFLGTDLRRNLATADAKFADVAAHDFRPRGGSPAVDYGQVIVGITDGFRGAAPDAGAYGQGDDWTAGAGELYERWRATNNAAARVNR